MEHKQHARQLGADRAGLDDALGGAIGAEYDPSHVLNQEPEIAAARLLQRRHHLGAGVARIAAEALGFRLECGR